MSLKSMLRKHKRVGLALGAGGARGIAHLGVLRVFDEESIPIDIIVGSSVGALVGGAYASGLDTYELEAKLEEFLKSPLFQDSALKSIRDIQRHDRGSLPRKIQTFFRNSISLTQAMFRQGLLHGENFQAMIDYFLPDIQFHETRVPFRAVATDLVSGHPVVLSQGSLRQGIMASCAVPGAVPPLMVDEKLLADGGIAYMVPTTIAREEGADFVVAVSVSSEIWSCHELSSAVDIYVRSVEIGSYYIEKLLLRDADVAITAHTGDLYWTDFDRSKDLIKEGERAAREKLLNIRKALPLRRRLRLFTGL
jgi:NTE family protein